MPEDKKKRGRPLIDYSGQIWGCWKVIERDQHPRSKSHETFWKAKCIKCGNEASVRACDLKKKPQSCNKCKGDLIHQTKIKNGELLHSIEPGDVFGFLTVLDRPKTAQHLGLDRCRNSRYVKCKCICGKELFIRVEHLTGTGRESRTISCGCQNTSSGELKVRQILQKYNIKFKEQYRVQAFDRIALFDFAVFDINNNLLKLIEYDGEQHFKPIEVWGGEEGFKNQQERDQNKNNWCEKNNINLLRIPYTDYNKIDIKYLFPNFPKLV